MTYKTMAYIADMILTYAACKYVLYTAYSNAQTYEQVYQSSKIKIAQFIYILVSFVCYLVALQQLGP